MVCIEIRTCGLRADRHWVARIPRKLMLLLLYGMGDRLLVQIRILHALG